MGLVFTGKGNKLYGSIITTEIHFLAYFSSKTRYIFYNLFYTLLEVGAVSLNYLYILIKSLFFSPCSFSIFLNLFITLFLLPFSSLAVKCSDSLLQDQFLLAPPSQPKKEIAMYISSFSISTPQIFTDLAEATKSGKNLILRSESWREYNGPSGILESFILKRQKTKGQKLRPVQKLHHQYIKGEITQQEMEKELLKQDNSPRLLDILNEYYKDVGEKAFDNISFSYWEHIEGTNRKVIADHAVPNRFHIFSIDSKRIKQDYTIWDNGKITYSFYTSRYGKTWEEISPQHLENLISTYKQIQNLPKFDKRQTPIMEFQSRQDVNYFLQYHRTRSFQAANFQLDRAPLPNEMVAAHVIGATPKEGIIFRFEPEANRLKDTNLLERLNTFDASYATYGNQMNIESSLHKRKEFLSQQPDLGNQIDPILHEIIARRRKMFLLSGGLEQLGSSGATHYNSSTMFKPKLAVFYGLDYSLMSRDFAYIKVVSDGTKAYFSFLDRDKNTISLD